MAIKWDVNYLKLKQREYILKHNKCPQCKGKINKYTIGNGYGKVETWYCNKCNNEYEYFFN